MNILGIDLGSIQTTAIIAQTGDNDIKVIGCGVCKTTGVKKGAITNIEPASRAIREAVEAATMMSGVDYQKVIVAISGFESKSIKSNGVVNIPNQDIGINEIHRAIATAKQSANVPQDYEIIHVLPFSFKIDDTGVEDPLGMSGIRLEVETNVILVKKMHIRNIRKAVDLIDLKVDNIVLSGYASAIACLDESEKEPGAVLIDMGGAVCDIVAHKDNSLRYNDCLPIGSQNITADLAYMLQTTSKAAEDLKIKFGSLDKKQGISTPVIGDDNRMRDTVYPRVAECIYIRIEETLMILAKMLDDSGYYKNIGSSIVLTGGMTKIADMLELASAIFTNHSVRIASAKRFIGEGGHHELFEDPQNSCAIGLCLYGAGYFTPYELDSNSKMRYPGEPVDEPVQQPVEEHSLEELFETSESEAEYEDLVSPVEEKKPSMFKKIIDKLTNQF